MRSARIGARTRYGLTPPPFGSIGQVLTKIQRDRSTGTFIVPYWPSRVWWPTLFPDGKQTARFITHIMPLPRSQDLFLPGPSAANEHAVGAPKWPVLAIRFDCTGLAYHHPPTCRAPVLTADPKAMAVGVSCWVANPFAPTGTSGTVQYNRG